MSKKIEEKLEQVKAGIVLKLEVLKAEGGGITLDFAKKNVDYMAVTAHFIDYNWFVFFTHN